MDYFDDRMGNGPGSAHPLGVHPFWANGRKYHTRHSILSASVSLPLVDEMAKNHLIDRESQRAIELAPGDPYVYWKRGVYLRYADRGDEAVAAHRRAESLDPFSLIAIEEVGWPFYYSRRFDEAVDQFSRAVELEPKWDQLYFGLGLALAQQQHYQQAFEAMRTATQLGPDNPFNQASLIYI